MANGVLTNSWNKCSWKPSSIGIGSSLSISSRKSSSTFSVASNDKTPCITQRSPTSHCLSRNETRSHTKGSKSANPRLWKLPEQPTKVYLCTAKSSELTPRNKKITTERPVTVASSTPAAQKNLITQNLSTKESVESQIPTSSSQNNYQIEDFSDYWNYQEQLPSIYAPLGYAAFKPATIRRHMLKFNLSTNQSYLSHINLLIRKKCLEALTADQLDDDEDTSSDDTLEADPGITTTLPVVSIKILPEHTVEDQPSSSTAPNGSLLGTDLLNLTNGNNQRKSSSETRTSSSPDDNKEKKWDSCVNRTHRKVKRSGNNGVNLIPIERASKEFEPDLPSVLDENITGTRLNPPAGHTKSHNRNSRAVSLRPLNTNDQSQNGVTSSHNPSHTNIVNPLSISGIIKPECPVSPENNYAGWTHAQNSKIPTVTKPPTITSPNSSVFNNSQQNSFKDSSSANDKIIITNRRHQRNVANGTSSCKSNSSNPRTKSSEGEPKYADPIAGSSSAFQARLSELASLEAETVRFERMRKMKKKTRDKDD